MAWLAVDEDGSERRFLVRPRTRSNGKWLAYMNTYNSVIPKGSIKKWIGYKLTWEDEPVELKI